MKKVFVLLLIVAQRFAEERSVASKDPKELLLPANKKQYAAGNKIVKTESMSYFIDAHCHPTLKRYLYGYSVFRPGKGRRDANYTDIQVTVPDMVAGGVHAGLTAHYLPEKQILTDWNIALLARPFLKVFLNKYIEKIEGEDAFVQTVDMIDNFENHVAENPAAVIAHNYEEFVKGLENKQIVFAHALEGGHHLGRGHTIEQFKRHIDILKSKGVALITLSHFYPNDITYPVEGIPPGTKKLLGMRFHAETAKPLTPIGKEVVATLLEKGIIVDLTHTNPESRSEIFAINRLRGAGNMRPLVFSHVGVRELFKDFENMKYSLMAPDDDEILAIKECNGVLGVIFMHYWLSGKEEKFLSSKDFCFEFVINTIKYIADLTGSFDHIAIGTDFDGMSDPPDDYYSPAMLKGFKIKLFDQKERLGASDEDLDKILGNNILRVLKDGWK